MSKKHKIKKKITVPEASTENKSIKVQAPVSLHTARSLISFDIKTKIFLFILLAAYFIVSSLKIHTSNISNWDMFFGLPESESVIAGKPRFIRMDEWMISTPAALGQYNAGLPLQNGSVGELNAPVVWGLPVKDISSALRPNLWSYFIFDIERAFAFSWNFSIFFFLISTFLLLMLLTKNNFWLSVTGAFFIFFSGGIQWWSYFIGNYMIYLNGIFISFYYLLYCQKKYPLFIAGIFLLLSAPALIFALYPPFEIPLIYLYLFLFIGFIWKEKGTNTIRKNLSLKAAVLGGVIIIFGMLMYHYYHLVKDTYALVLNTVYPGKRFSTGGDMINGKLFSEFYGVFLHDLNVPSQWQNICEASNFIMFFPIVFYAMGYYYYKTKKIDPLLIAITAFLLIGLIYVLVGFPAFLSKITLFSMSPAFRTLPVVGLANCFLLICFLASKRTEIKNEKKSWLELAIITVSAFIFIALVNSYTNKVTDNFFPATQMSIVTILVVASYLLVRYKNFKYVRPALYLTLVGLVINNAGVNPVTKGLAPIFENPLVIDSKPIYKADPKARWALFGNIRLTNLLKANGIDLFNSVKLVPPLNDMKVLDPTGKSDSVYNRYAWMTMNSKQVAHLFDVTWGDTAVFKITYQDGYTLFIDPCSPKFKKLGVKYFVFDEPPVQKEVRCMTLLKESAGIYIYKRND